MRFLCGHYLALSSPQRDGFVGLVQRGVSLTEIAQVGWCFLSFESVLLLNLGRSDRLGRSRRITVFFFHASMHVDSAIHFVGLDHPHLPFDLRNAARESRECQDVEVDRLVSTCLLTRARVPLRTPTTHIQGAAIEAATICCHALGACPEIRMSVDPAGDGLVAAVPEYVHYVVLELLKNAMRATMQAHGAGKAVAGEGGSGAGTGMDVAGEESARVQEREEVEGGNRNAGDAAIVFADVPEVVISVRAHGDDDVMLVVADQGGGIPAEATDKVSLCFPWVWPAGAKFML